VFNLSAERQRNIPVDKRPADEKIKKVRTVYVRSVFTQRNVDAERKCKRGLHGKTVVQPAAF
jgi:hypothetical protein